MLRVNTIALNEALLKKGLSVEEARMLLSMSTRQMARLLNTKDPLIQMRTAKKLRRVFGSGVVYVPRE